MTTTRTTTTKNATTRKNATKLAELHRRYVALGERLGAAVERGDIREQNLSIRLIDQTLAEVRRMHAGRRGR